MNGRAVLKVMGATALILAACSKGGNSQDRAGATQSRVLGALPPVICSQQPWADSGLPCGDTKVEPGRITCGDLGMDGITLTPTDSDGDGYRTAAHMDASGIETEVIGHEVDVDGTAAVTWSFGTTVKADGSTRTFDAVIFADATANASYVAKFSTPQFNVRDLFMTLKNVDTIEICGLKPGQAASLPPPEPDAGPFEITCEGNGSLTGPGPTVHSQSEIQWHVSVSPKPAQGSLVSMNAMVGAEVGLGTTFTVLQNGELSGGFSHSYLTGGHGELSLKFAYGSASCTLHWNVVEDDTGSSSGASGTSGQAW